jgi:hypothetical protein
MKVVRRWAWIRYPCAIRVPPGADNCCDDEFYHANDVGEVANILEKSNAWARFAGVGVERFGLMISAISMID